MPYDPNRYYAGLTGVLTDDKIKRIVDAAHAQKASTPTNSNPQILILNRSNSTAPPSTMHPTLRTPSVEYS